MHRPRMGMVRIGVQFADGRIGGQGLSRGRIELPKDEQGFPTQPFVGFGGGGGGSGGWRLSAWVFPLPPDGPLEVFVSIAAAGLDEGSGTLDGTAIRAVAEQAQV